MDEKTLLLLNRIISVLDTEDKSDATFLEMLQIGQEITSREYNEASLISIREKLDDKYKDILQGVDVNVVDYISFLQLRFLLDKRPTVFADFLKALDMIKIPVHNKYFLWTQCSCFMFEYPSLISDDNNLLYLKIYKDIVDEYEALLAEKLERIPFAERNENAIIMLTSQFTVLQHGPTKSCFYRAKVLTEEGGKNVLIINTNDLAPSYGVVPLFRRHLHNQNENLLNASVINDGDAQIEYFQCDMNMPNSEVISVLLEQIRQIRPAYIINIGGYNITANLANKMVPVFTIGMLPSKLQYDGTDYFAYSGQLDDEIYRKLEQYGGRREALIPSVFTSDLKEQTEMHTRDEVGIPKDKWIVGVVGSRLKREVDNAFINCLKECIDDEMMVVFIGNFDSYESICHKDTWFLNHTMHIGFAEDILSHIELCDVYLNPKRIGGGTSSVEAMSKGVVPVSLDFGDVAYNIGKEFVVDSIPEMKDRIQKLRDDKSYYEKMSNKAKERAAYLCDTKHRFIDTIRELERRIEAEGK